MPVQGTYITYQMINITKNKKIYQQMDKVHNLKINRIGTASKYVKYYLHWCLSGNMIIGNNQSQQHLR